MCLPTSLLFLVFKNTIKNQLLIIITSCRFTYNRTTKNVCIFVFLYFKTGMQDYWGLEDDSIINKPKRKSEGANNEDEQPISSGSNGNRLLIEK